MPMWSSVANLKESLSKIALDVHDDDDEELSMYSSTPRDQLENGNSVSERRISRNFSRSNTPTHSPIVNGLDSPSNHEIEQYKAEIKRLQESEAEIKALSVNYAALLKEKEDQISKLTEENGSLKQNLLTTNAALSASRTAFKELSDTMEDKSRSLAVMQATHEAQIKQMTLELDKERGKLTSMQTRLQEEQKLNGSFQQELSSLKDENNKMLGEMNKTRDELNQKISEIGRLQMELQRRHREETDDTVEKLKQVVAILEDENRNIKKEKDGFEATLKALRSSTAHNDVPGDVNPSDKHASNLNKAFPGQEQMQQSLRKLEKDLKETCQEKDKALQELNRLKQHLLEKESEESEKMDEDSKIIEELREINEHQRIQILRLEQALKQAIGSQEEIKLSRSQELKKAKETIDELNRKLTSCLSTIDAKNVEVLNLQTALGQYYAEIEAKERLVEELSVAKEESARLTKQLKKLEEDNEKLRRALEQSMTRLNRMSVDSDFLVDRRIVIKLLVTYFQRNHSKEVLDLMVRMLGFSDEDKQRIGVAQQGAGKGVVRGVLGLPGRLVGGILGGGSAEAHTSMASDNQSFADLWVDFLLKETEREKRESADAAASGSNPDQNSTGTTPPLPRPSPFLSQHQMPSYALQREPSDSEFSTVPLSSSESNLQSSRLLPRY
ncbi:hypothetical protein CDL12_07148 [Handroanthus impetiginosus]|uniref:Uncharacterized protein n=1 Tax=Handroanthus impetiginosus TaxID=429701 RepID=A0A2G9HRN2_9LAMI|nr:hypothetical protein CDL12_07148 [Handroanthus impetiginosus]